MGAKRTIILNRFNYGIVSKLAFARREIAKIALAAEEQTNIVARALGAGRLRAGMGYLGMTHNNRKVRCEPFVYGVNDTAILEFSHLTLRPLIDESAVIYPAVTTSMTNGEFAVNLNGWSGRDDFGALSYWSGGFLALRSTGETAVARRWQRVSVTGANQHVRHCIKVVVKRGEVRLDIGATLGGGDYVRSVVLARGATQSESVHFLSFVPSGDFFIEISGAQEYADALVESIELHSGLLVLPTDYAEDDVPFIRKTQVNDVVYVACRGKHPKKIIRYGTYSWGIEEFAPHDGAFGLINTTDIALTPSALNGQIILAANAPYFTQMMVNSLLKITANGQQTRNELAGSNQFSDYIRITGVTSTRRFNIVIAGAWSGTLVLQRSVGEPNAWVDAGTVYTANGNYFIQDTDDNAIYYYRIGFTNAHVSGTAIITMATGAGSITGVVRILDVLSPTNAIASVLKPLGGTSATTAWYKGIWCDGEYPTAVAMHEGRLWWAGKDRIIASASDALESYDEEIEGDSAPINVIIGSNGNDTINWLLPLFRLVIGGEIAERTVRSTSLDEPLTPTNFSIKKDSTRGSSPIEAVEVDQAGFFVRNHRLFHLAPSDRVDTSYQAKDVTMIAPEVGESGFTRIAVQRYPDTRIHALRGDGKVALFVFDELEEVQCWQIIETDGFIEDVFVIPAEANAQEDKVYYVVRRVINGATVRHICKWAFEHECVGGVLNKQADSFVVWTGDSNRITGLQHLEGKNVVVWADGKDYSAGYGENQRVYVVVGGAITLPDAINHAVVGLPYRGRYKSSKLAYTATYGEGITFTKRVSRLGVVMLHSHNRGLRFGQDFNALDELPLKHEETLIAPDQIWSEFDENVLEFDGDWDGDSRVCLEMHAPRPCTVLALVIGLEVNDAL